MKPYLRNHLLFSLLVLVTSINAETKKSNSKTKPNIALTNIPDQTAKLIQSDYKGDKGVLSFSGMAYDHHRHKILAFGGGHATGRFPNSVHEFDFKTLKWSQLTEDVPPSAYGKENAVMSKDGAALGGLKWKGKIWASSRHTYDGLAVMPNQDILICGQQVGAIGAKNKMPEKGKLYVKHYGGSTGLWMFDPIKKEWSVSPKNKLVAHHGATATNPEAPDWFYIWGHEKKGNGSFKVNFKTFEKVLLAKPPRRLGNGPDFSAEYYPERKSILFFPRKNVAFPRDRKPSKIQAIIHEYNIEKNTWTTLKPSGDAPETFARNAVYDTRHNVFSVISHDTNQFHYYDPRGNKWYKLDKKLNVEVYTHHFIYSPVENIYISVGNRWKTYAYKFTDEKGKYEGTIGYKSKVK